MNAPDDFDHFDCCGACDPPCCPCALLGLIASAPNIEGDRMETIAETMVALELRDRVAEIAAAWDVWGEAQHEIRKLVQTAEWSGDLPDGGQRARLHQQFNAQIFEAYARARVQCAIVRAVDAVDQLPEYERHWDETWGATTATKAAAAYAERYAAALERQRAARAAATAQSAALTAAGVPA